MKLLPLLLATTMAGSPKATEPRDATALWDALEVAWSQKDAAAYLSLWDFADEESRKQETDFVTDLFETITLWENRAISATYKAKPGGRYEVTLKVSAKKLRADENGKQSEVPMDDLVDIGVLGADEQPLYLKKHRIKAGETTLTLEVAGKPAKAGIDPVVKLIDRRPDDNTVVAAPG